MATTVGVISDTHGMLRPEARAALADCDLIVHAGDVGSPEVLSALEAIAPLRAVRGNVDTGGWAAALPDIEVIEVDGLHFYVLHDLGALDLDPAAAGFRVVISGHLHRPRVDEKDGVLYFNPGSAGPRRFSLPVVLGKLHVDGDRVRPERVDLIESPAAP